MWGPSVPIPNKFWCRTSPPCTASGRAVAEGLQGRSPQGDGPGDWALVLEPLPKIALCYHFYLPDEDFPANVTCLYANNADRFLPTDALADVGEYMSRALIAQLS